MSMVCLCLPSFIHRYTSLGSYPLHFRKLQYMSMVCLCMPVSMVCLCMPAFIHLFIYINPVYRTASSIRVKLQRTCSWHSMNLVYAAELIFSPPHLLPRDVPDAAIWVLSLFSAVLVWLLSLWDLSLLICNFLRILSAFSALSFKSWLYDRI